LNTGIFDTVGYRMRKYLDDLELRDVSRLSGAKPTTIKLWLHRKQLDAPPILDKNRIFAAEHVLQVILMKLLTDRGIPARKAGPKARQLEPEVLRRLEAGESPDVSDVPLQAVLGTYLKRCQRYEAKRKAEEAAREAEEARRAEEREREQQEWAATWGNKEWIWEQQRKAEQTGDWQLWQRCEQALNNRWVGQVRSIPERKRGRGRPIGSYGVKTW
jgi:DNA-binding transcriptional MerR regulator